MGWPNPSCNRWIGGGDRAVIEDGLTLSVHKLMRAMGSAAHRSGVWQWSCNSEPCGSISYSAQRRGDDCGLLLLSYRAEGQPVEQTIDLVRRPCRFGGGRWFAICPHKGQVAAKLYLPPGARLFLSRGAYRVAYRSQCLGRGERALLIRDRHVARLGLGDWEFPLKPKWMRRRTFKRAVARLEHLDAVWNREFLMRFGSIL